jgi:uncharacterized protein (TIGR03067 family)
MRAVLLIALCLFIAPDREDPTPKKQITPAEMILGEWHLDKLTLGGGLGNPPEKEGTRRTMHLTPKEIVTKENGIARAEDSASYTIDWTKSPVEIDLLPKNGPQKALGILKLETDILTICFRVDSTRPATFRTDGKDLVVLIELKRVK